MDIKMSLEFLEKDSRVGSESSGLHSDADEIPDSDNEESQLIEEFQDLTPRDGRGKFLQSCETASCCVHSNVTFKM